MYHGRGWPANRNARLGAQQIVELEYDRARRLFEQEDAEEAELIGTLLPLLPPVPVPICQNDARNTSVNGMLKNAVNLVSIVAAAVLVTGCGEKAPSEVVVYTALDREFSEPIFADFTKKTGIAVRSKFDTESTKTVELAQTIISERNRPRCDLYWNNEILNTLRLERQGLLRSYNSPAAADFPASARSPKGMWHGFAARARVLLVNTNQVSEERRPKSIRDLTDPQWRCGIAKPLFGTTATHAACLFAAWGDQEAKDFFTALKVNAQILSGNKQVAQAVAGGKLAVGLTDTDDALIEIANGMPVAIVYPDQEEGQMGTLFIPNTLALIKGSPNPEHAQQLVDYLLSAEVERQLAEGPSAQIPLRPGVPASPRVKTPSEVRAMNVDWNAAAEKWDTAAEFLKTEFTQ
jgi:iron(III) transport system substrate-binding protein